MIKIKTLFLLLLSFCGLTVSAQNPEDFTIDLCATTQLYALDTTRTSITVNWPAFPTNPLLLRYRFKAKNASLWSPWETLATNATSFTDTILTGTEREYQVEADTIGGFFPRLKYGNILVGNKVDHGLIRGRILLLIDSTYLNVLDSALEVYKYALWNDGYIPIVDYIDNASTPPYVRSVINTVNSSAGPTLFGVVLIGHIPVPYSGDFDAFSFPPPDGHTTTAAPPSHEGAWSTDMYYGDINGTWTDNTVNNTLGARTENHNTVGDGKFDNTAFPSPIELPVGRIDFDNLPVFPQSDTVLMLRYLAKDVAYRSGQTNYVGRVLQDDHLGLLTGEPFGGSSFQLSHPLFGQAPSKLNWHTTLQTNNYQWAQGFGFGAYNNCVNVVSSANFATTTYRTTFTTLFGSYFGDFDSENNLMRSALASRGEILTCAWNGRPKWFFHQMGTGNPIGTSVLRSQNTWNGTQSLYPDAEYSTGFVHQTFLGDISLTNNPYSAVDDFAVTQDSCRDGFDISWSPHQDSNIIGYVLQRFDSIYSSNRTLTVYLTDTFYNDRFPRDGINVYMVKAIKTINNCSGMHYEYSHGVFDSVSIELPEVFAGVDTFGCPGDTVNIGTNHTYASHIAFEWIEGEGIGDTAAQNTIAIVPTTNSIYVLQTANTISGCVAYDTLNINPFPIPGSGINPIVPESFCEDTISISANSAVGNTYNWLIDSSNVRTFNTPGPHQIYWTEVGSYAIRLRVTHTLNSCILNDSIIYNLGCVLPQELLESGYTYSNNCNNINVNFKTTNENNVLHYDIVGLFEGDILQTHRIIARAFSTAQINSYSTDFSLFNLGNIDQIIIKAQDNNSAEYEVTQFSVATPTCRKEFKLIPNPLANAQMLKIEGISRGDIVEIYNAQGTLVYSDQHNDLGPLTLKLSAKAGMYFVKIGEAIEKLILY